MSQDLEYYIPKYKMDELMPGGYQYALKKITNLDDEFDHILFHRRCKSITRSRADNDPSVLSFGVKAILIDKSYPTNIWLVDERFSKAHKMKISIPGGHISGNITSDTVEEVITGNLIREMYEEFSSGDEYKDEYVDDIAHHLRILGFDYAECTDDWYYQYTPDYLSFFKVIYVSPKSFIAGRNTVDFSLSDYDDLELMYKYNQRNFIRLAKIKLEVPNEIRSDIRLSHNGRYTRMLKETMELVRNLNVK